MGKGGVMRKTIFLSDSKPSTIENHIEVPYIFYDGKWREDVKYVSIRTLEDSKLNWKQNGYLIK